MNIQGSPSKRKAEDDSDNDNSKKPKIELPKEEYQYFPQLFYEAFEFIMKTMKVSNTELKNGIGTVAQSFKTYEEGKRFTDIINKSENLCAYFHSYSLLNTEVSRNKILDAVNNCQVLQDHLKRDQINVVSVGGGPGCDIVGMLSAFYEKVNCKKLNVTVVDNVERWKSFLNIVEFLLREGDFGNACSMFKKSNTSLSFVCEDVLKANSEKTPYSKIVKNADIILMKHLLSNLTFDEQDEVAKNVVQKMKNGTLLLLIETPKLFYVFKKLEELEQIYPLNPAEAVYDDFYVQGNYPKYFGYTAKESNGQIAIFKKNLVKED